MSKPTTPETVWTKTLVKVDTVKLIGTVESVFVVGVTAIAAVVVGAAAPGIGSPAPEQ
jgi:hypothetical protein